jgi:hypothetical protein
LSTLRKRPSRRKVRQPFDPDCFGEHKGKPPVEELKQLAASMTVAQIAEHYGTTEKRAREWIYRSNLQALPAKPGTADQNLDFLHRKFDGDRQKIAVFIESNRMDVIQVEYDAADSTLRRLERKYQTRWMRVCHMCTGSYRYVDMHMASRGSSNHCKTCWEAKQAKPKERVVTYDVHWRRVDAEYTGAGVMTARLRMSDAQKINGWFRGLGRVL